MKTIPKTKNEAVYIDWLCSTIKEEHHKAKYDNLCSWLYYQEFYAILPNDDNRVEDGLKLRETFGIQLDKPCSMLEMLIALAERMDYILFEKHHGNRFEKWFWLFIRNLNLQSVFYDSEPEENQRNLMIVKRFIERKYSRNGRGGLFPLKHTRNDQRSVEIWYQMMAYIEEIQG